MKAKTLMGATGTVSSTERVKAATPTASVETSAKRAWPLTVTPGGFGTKTRTRVPTSVGEPVASRMVTVPRTGLPKPGVNGAVEMLMKQEYSGFGSSAHPVSAIPPNAEERASASPKPGAERRRSRGWRRNSVHMGGCSQEGVLEWHNSSANLPFAAPPIKFWS
jgi:hypothetical protein